MTVEQLRRRHYSIPNQGCDSSIEQLCATCRDADGLLVEWPCDAEALLDVAEAADVLSGYARHENDCARTAALMAGETGTPCNCGFKVALASYQAALSRLDTEGGT